MIKIAHEAPLCFFDLVEEHTDYSYALVHLFEENPDYFGKFVQARDKGREIILDNSIFELGHAFDAVKFAEWIELLRPTWYIIPDVLEDAEGTVANLYAWKMNTFFEDLPGKSIGVVQGKTYDEIVWCYKRVEPLVDKVAIPFDCSYYEELNPDTSNKLKAWSLGRNELLQRLQSDGIINRSKPHHLLGVGLIWEFFAYARKYPWIDSVDTSNPVMWAIENGVYPKNSFDINTKPQTKLFTLIDWKPETEAECQVIREDIIHNIKQFREVINS